MSQPAPRIIEYYQPHEVLESAAAPDAEEQETIDEINTKVAAEESVEAIIDFVFRRTYTVDPCDRIGIAFVEDEGRRLVSYHTRAEYEPILLKKGYAEDLAGSSLEAIIKWGRLRLIHDLAEYQREHPESRSTRLLVREGVRSSMTCPLRVSGRIVGVLFRSARRVFAFNVDDLARHVRIAERLSQAVEKAWRIEQLNAANRAYLDLLGFISHELKAPLGTMVTEGRLLVDGYLGELNERQTHHVGRLIRQGEYLLSLIREYLDLARMENDTLSPRVREDVDVTRELIEPALEINALPLEESGMRVERPGPEESFALACDPDLLKIVMVNLINNAIKYGHEGGLIRITAGRTDEGATRIAVWNQGPGFPAAQRPRLFRKFSRLHTPELQRHRGTGVGLYTSWRIVRMHGGQITADSTEGEWAEFAFTIPNPPVSDEAHHE